MPPTITASYPGRDDVWTLEPGLNKAFVRAFDEDKDDLQRLEFFWTIERLGEQGTAVPITGNEVGSWLHLQGDTIYSGKTLTCRVVDPSGGASEISWELEFSEEAP